MSDNKETLIEKFHRIIESCQNIGASGAMLELDYADLAHVVDALECRAAQPVVLSDEQRNAIAMDAVRIFADLLNSELFDEPKDKAVRSDIRNMAKNFKPAYWNVGKAILAAKEQA